ncbi:MAG: PD40 domain-containing protein [Gemmatimonadetes bacterium]|nr:PD40 domain-containing protein [Gemmatimonadota bacterium]
MARPLSRTRLAGPVLGLVLALAATHPAGAQYFGRNKVQYRDFDFQVMRTEHFDVYFYPGEEKATRDAARMAERWYSRLSRVLDHQFEKRQPVILYASHPDFQQTSALSGEIDEATGGVTEVFKQRVVLPFAYSYEETDHVLGHELVHAFQYDISGLGRAGGGLDAASQRFQVPGWFVEGMAEYLSVGPVDPLTANWLRNAAISGKIPTIDQLGNDPTIFPYRYGQALWAYVGGRWGDAAIGQVLKLTGEGTPYEEAFQRVLGVSVDTLSEDWHAAIRRAYLPLLNQRGEARELARPLINARHEGGRLNVGPVLSPDGKWVAFLSEMKFIDVELNLANAETGEVVRTLQKGTALDSHFGSLRYIHSAGTWSPDGKQFALSAQRGGEDVLVILDVRHADRVREIPVDGVGEITSPTWSPDGRTLVVSGLTGGITDLYAVDLGTGRSRKLTDDRFTELQPAFSPDGRRLAFVTDRFGTRLDALTYGAYQLAIMDLATGAVTPVPGMAGSHNIDPQWTADGAGLFFISNRTGIPNVYRVDLGSGALAQVTDIYSGVSGITDVSPALSVSRRGDRLVFTAFEDQGYDLYSITDPKRLAGTPLSAAAQAVADGKATTAALLPPSPRDAEPAFNRVAALLADATTGLPSPTQAESFAVAPYHAKLGLDYLGQPQVGASIGGPFGGGVYGGIFGIFSDVLGRHTVGAAIQAQGKLDEIGGAVQYLNRGKRWNYGFGAQRTPYVYGYYAEGVDPAEPDVYRQQLVRLRYFDTSLQGVVQYPFSAVQRVELSGGFRRIAQDQQVYEALYDLRTGAGLNTQTRDLGGVGYNMFESSAAWVYDDAVFGYTAPMAGQRARLEVSPVLGQLRFTTALADYRRYLFVRPFTLAVRGLTYGRYGRDAEGVFADQYLGYSSLIRGYESVYNRCSESGQDCGLLEGMVGSRVAVANAELRFPLIRRATVGNGFALPPIDGFGFYDAGVAWTSATRPSLQRGIPDQADLRGLLTSAGVGTRTNLFGYAVLEVDYVRALESTRGWHWVFALQPGF